MNIEEFDYPFDESFIAQSPLLHREESKLMILNKETGEIEHIKDGMDIMFFEKN